VKAAALTGAAMPFAGCESILSRVTGRMGQTIPDSIRVASAPQIDPAFHLLSRAAHGPWPGDLDRVSQMGADAWIEEQLSPESIDDTLCDLRARRFETLQHEPGTCYEYKKPVLREEIARHTLLRAIYSRRQLFEIMVGFWTDHLNINIEKADCIYLKPADDREVVRRHALGKFRDLIRASAVSPAMLFYLDGRENKKAGPDDIPNENYARELLELHTLGVHGGYTQKDVYEVARCLTGWRLRTKWRRGTVFFEPRLHDDGTKSVLGYTIPPAPGELGAGDLERVVDIVSNHPSTSRFVATKLVRRFVSDQPPLSLVEKVAAVFTETGGDIKSLVRTILKSDEFNAARGTKFKRPFNFVVSSLRALGADTHAHSPLIEYLMRMGQGLFQHPTPDGYPDEAQPWLGGLLWRWNFAFALASNQVPSAQVSLDLLARALEAERARPATATLLAHFIGRSGSQQEIQALEDYVSSQRSNDGPHPGELVGLILASPAFQRC
jgi:uncharacterized protein (DUF1800 family)